jgi:capsular exopolysaccharide synthesis family protein
MSRNFELMQQATQGFDASMPKKDRRLSKAQDEKVSPPGISLGSGVAAREETHKLVQRIFLQHTQNAPRTIVFASVNSGTASSQICLLVADALRASVGGSVCIVEANFRSPTLPGLIGTTNHYGLTEALIQLGPIRSFAKPIRSEDVWFISSGSVVPDSPNLLDGDRIKERFTELRQEFDYVLVDAPPLSRYADATVLGRITDGMVLVLEADVTRKEVALRVMQNLRASQIKVLGAVLNKRTPPIPEPRSMAASV